MINKFMYVVAMDGVPYAMFNRKENAIAECGVTGASLYRVAIADTSHFEDAMVDAFSYKNYARDNRFG